MAFKASKNGIGERTTADGLCCFQCPEAKLVDIGFWFWCKKFERMVAAKEGCDEDLSPVM